MAARPRNDYVYFVTAVGPSWVGFWYVYDQAGKRIKRQRKIGERKAMSLTEARSNHAAWVRENVTTDAPEPPAPTLRTLWERHIASIGAKVEKGKRALHWQRTLKTLWAQLEPLHDREASTITGDEVEVVFDSLAEKYSASTCRKTRALLAQLLRGHTVAVKDADMRFESDPKGKVLSIAEVQALRAQLTGKDRLILDVYLFLGLSADEGALLEVRHVGPDRIWVPGTKTDYRVRIGFLDTDQPVDLKAKTGGYLVSKNSEDIINTCKVSAKYLTPTGETVIVCKHCGKPRDADFPKWVCRTHYEDHGMGVEPIELDCEFPEVPHT